jgi:hypothetical protein
MSNSVRVMLCEQRAHSGRSMLLDIVRTQVLDDDGSASLQLVHTADSPDAEMIVQLEDLDRALAASQPDVLLVLADAMGLARARTAAQRHGGIDVVAVTRAGYVLIDLAPSNLSAVLRALGAARRERAAS